MRSHLMRLRRPASHYFHKARHFRVIAEGVGDPDTKAMVMAIAVEYEQMGDAAARQQAARWDRDSGDSDNCETSQARVAGTK